MLGLEKLKNVAMHVLMEGVPAYAVFAASFKGIATERASGRYRHVPECRIND